MRCVKRLLCCAGALLVAAATSTPASAQMVNVSTPFHSINDSFFENYNIGWGYNGRRPDGSGFFFNGPGAAPPPFGGYDPSGDATFGAGNGRGFFNIAASQGSSRSMSSTIPSVTSMNGYGGSISNTTIRPFVTGFTPVVGGGGGARGILVMPRYPTMADFQPNYASPLGATREAVYQHVQEAKQLVATKKLRAERAQNIEDSKALAAERARLRERSTTGGDSDDPPLRISQ